MRKKNLVLEILVVEVVEHSVDCVKYTIINQANVKVKHVNCLSFIINFRKKIN